MSVQIVSGDPLLTQADFLAFAHNARARTEMGPLETRLLRAYPAAFATYSKMARHKRISTGEYMMWRESAPKLIFMVLRQTAVGATRLRYVQDAAMKIIRDHRLEGIKRLAVAPLCDPVQWDEVKKVLVNWFNQTKLPVIIYDKYIPDEAAEETL
jgi:hypothetical protein